MPNRPHLIEPLKQVYALKGFVPRAFPDVSDHAFLSITHIERSVALLAPEFDGEVLDVGCGRRPYRSYFQHVKRMRGCDFDAARGPVDFACPADKIPLPDQSLDGILCTEVLEHVPDPLAVWREFYRVLRPGGKVLLSTPMYWPGHEEPYDFYRYPEFGLRRLLAESGFELKALVPRGGVWVFLGQAILHAMPQYLRFRWQRSLHNRLFLWLDRWRLNPNITVGWTVYAVRK
jgi:SAM-dependent methyltransferase